MSRHQSWVVPAVIGANYLVYIAWHSDRPRHQAFMSNNFLCSAKHLRQGRYWTLATSLFSHCDWKHFTGNMVTLRMLGTPLLQAVGAGKVLLVYLVGGVLANVFYLIFTRRRGMNTAVLGASGSVSALLGMIAMIYPDAVLTAGPELEVPLLVYAPVYLLWESMQSFSLVDREDQVAHPVHMAGLIFGLVCGWFFVRYQPRRRPYNSSDVMQLLQKHSRTALRLLAFLITQ
eukprot:gb/GEZN01013848.1/.p1 GENE.gb/GEZN01013848.1/~~gb/GEZN01013848.1/.p1  ORF type:complete len:231 (+),score=3.81 gb/GEZN01013848.1/:120-812(+)